MLNSLCDMLQTVSSNNMTKLLRTPIAIVGGGPTGLMLSNLFSACYSVPHVLLERQTVEQRFKHPQAHFLNTRTMELLKYWLQDCHDRIQKAMPPVEEWRSFRFGASMSAQVPLAVVRHPVERPLQQNRDANGVLVEGNPDVNTMNHATSDEKQGTKDLSTCTVGHLAQHTLGQILYEQAIEAVDQHTMNGDYTTQLLYGCRVNKLHWNDEISADGSPRNSPPAVLETDCGRTIIADVVLAADGSDSAIRRALRIPSRGTQGIEHLINIHVRLSPEQAARLHKNNNYAMLYSIFSPHVLAMVVCHSPGEYIIQIPFFPPYQTLHDDFGPQKQRQILQAIFGDAVSQWEVLSIAPWRMSALVADYYVHKNVALVGDAAHVFPPAGGFGMNTGLQDAHNVAWKLAEAYHTKQLSSSSSLLQSYDRERRPIALENAELSRRNYKRLLGVVRSTYMDKNYSSFLNTILDNSPLPLSIRRLALRSSIQTAMYPFSWLDQPASIYAQHIRANIRAVLKRGAGLPLLFPDFELNFRYADPSKQRRARRQEDTFPSQPTVEVGKLVPHETAFVETQSIRCFPRSYFTVCDANTETSRVSTSNLPIQLSIDNKPTYVLLGIGGIPAVVLSQASDAIAQSIGLPVLGVVLSLVDDDSDEYSSEGVLKLQIDNADSCFTKGAPYVLLVRPDGHILAKAEHPADWDILHNICCTKIDDITGLAGLA